MIDWYCNVISETISTLVLLMSVNPALAIVLLAGIVVVLWGIYQVVNAIMCLTLWAIRQIKERNDTYK